VSSDKSVRVRVEYGCALHYGRVPRTLS